MSRWLIASILFFCCAGYAPTLKAETNQSKPRKIWIVAPGVWDQAGPEFSKYQQRLQGYLEKSTNGPVIIELKTAKGFVVEQLLNLQKEIEKEKPEWIFYVQRGDFYAYDLRELLESKTKPLFPASSEKFTKNEMESELPTWITWLFKGATFDPIKEAMFLERRLKGPWQKAVHATDTSDLTLRTAMYASEMLKDLLRDQTKLVFLISPERLEFQNNLFPGNDLKNIIARTYFTTVNVDRATLKNQLMYSGLDYALLPKEYGDLSQSENLVAGSAYILNSTGILKSFQILTPVISDYLRAEAGSR